MRAFVVQAGGLLLAAFTVFALTNGCGPQQETDCGTGYCVCSDGGCKCRDNVVRCDRQCKEDCDMTCTDNHPCDLSCGFDCKVTCASTDVCTVTVGSGSQVTCSGPGKCNVTCRGSCKVTRSAGVGGLFTCETNQISHCADGVDACGDC